MVILSKTFHFQSSKTRHAIIANIVNVTVNTAKKLSKIFNVTSKSIKCNVGIAIAINITRDKVRCKL